MPSDKKPTHEPSWMKPNISYHHIELAVCSCACLMWALMSKSHRQYHDNIVNLEVIFSDGYQVKSNVVICDLQCNENIWGIIFAPFLCRTRWQKSYSIFTNKSLCSTVVCTHVLDLILPEYSHTYQKWIGHLALGNIDEGQAYKYNYVMYDQHL